MSQQGWKVCPQSPTHWLIVKEEIDLFGNVQRMAERDIARLYEVLEISQVKRLIEAFAERIHQREECTCCEKCEPCDYQARI